MKLLEDESNLLRSHAIQFGGGDASNIPTVQPDFAGSGSVEAANQIYKCRFTRSRWAHDGKPLALRHVQGNVIESANRVALILLVTGALLSCALRRVEFRDVFDLNHFTPPSE